MSITGNSKAEKWAHLAECARMVGESIGTDDNIGGFLSARGFAYATAAFDDELWSAICEEREAAKAEPLDFDTETVEEIYERLRVHGLTHTRAVEAIKAGDWGCWCGKDNPCPGGATRTVGCPVVDISPHEAQDA